MAEFMSVHALTEAELDQLAVLLGRHRDEGAMNLEELDGFLAAVTCGPDRISQLEYIGAALGGIVEPEAVSQIASLIRRHQEAMAQTLKAGGLFTPILLQDENGVSCANDWAQGFLRGMQWNRREWLSLMDDEAHGGLIIPIFALAHEHDPDPEMRPYKEPVTPERREQLIVGMAASVMGIYRYFKVARLTVSESAVGLDTVRRIRPKAGRNDPCPCGSGKKFKQCCGRLMLH
jgi:uncharacterized protein